MAWGKVDDKLHSHVKWRRASKGARALWTTALSWCSSFPSDGIVPTDMLGYLDGTRAEARSLVAVGLWDEVDEGWRFHEWEERNPDGDSAKAAVQAKRAGGQRGNHERWHVKRGLVVEDCEWCTESHTDRTKRSLGESSVPVPVPIPISSARPGHSGDGPPKRQTSLT